jgi:hypothetical protein
MDIRQLRNEGMSTTDGERIGIWGARSGGTQYCVALDRLFQIVLEGLRHGHFRCAISSSIGKGNRRELVIEAGKSHKVLHPRGRTGALMRLDNGDPWDEDAKMFKRPAFIGGNPSRRPEPRNGAEPTVRSSVKSSQAANQKSIEPARRVCQPRLGRNLGHDDILQIAENRTGIFTILARAEVRSSVNETAQSGPSLASEKDNSRGDRCPNIRVSQQAGLLDGAPQILRGVGWHKVLDALIIAAFIPCAKYRRKFRSDGLLYYTSHRARSDARMAEKLEAIAFCAEGAR